MSGKTTGASRPESSLLHDLASGGGGRGPDHETQSRSTNPLGPERRDINGVSRREDSLQWREFLDAQNVKFVCQTELTRWGSWRAGLCSLFPIYHGPWFLAGSGAACSEPRAWTQGECNLSCPICPFWLGTPATATGR